MSPDELTMAMPSQVESGLILSGPDDDIFDDIFDWIANAINAISGTVTSWIDWAVRSLGGTVTSWISWLWGEIGERFAEVLSRLRGITGDIGDWISDTIGDLRSWISLSISSIVGSLGTWFSQQLSQISSLFEGFGSTLSAWFNDLWGNIAGYFSSLDSRLEGWFTWQMDQFVLRVLLPMATWWDLFLLKLFDVPSWIGGLLDGVAAWLAEDVPGSSPRWEGIMDGIGRWFYYWFGWYIGQWIEDPAKQAVHTVQAGLGWVGDWFTGVFETFMEAIMGLVEQIGPTNPSTAVGSYSAMARVGMLSLGGLAAMTIAGETLNPISHLGLGHISAMIYDMTNYKLITGVFMGALTIAMLKQPLTYYFNQVFRPLILEPRDFQELMSRDAFRHPELLQEPELTTSIQQLTGGQGTAWEAQMIGFYGYPAEYHGLFRELSHARLGYFALAGIARTGFWDEDWFIEALSRTGYSVTAREALLVMYQEQVKYARQQPVMYHLRRLAREGYYTIDQVKEILAEVNAMESLDDIRVRAMALEQEYETFDMALDISLRAFSRGVIQEKECRDNLSGLNIPRALIDVHLTREKLGIIRRISWTPPEQAPSMQYVEE